MRRILVPVDGSICSQFAAAHVAERMHAGEALSLHLLNVQDRPADAEELGRAALAPVLAVLAESGVAGSSEIAVGDPDDVIIEQAANGAYDEIVMGTRGTSVIGSILVGSIATKVVSSVALPITLVPTPTLTMHRRGRATPENAALSPAAAARRLTLVPVDGSEASDCAIDQVIAEAGRGAIGELVVMNVQASGLQASKPSDDLAPAIDAAPQQEGMRLMSTARARLSAAGLSFRSIVAVGDPAESIARIAKEEAATRIVMGTRGAGAIAQLLFGSTAKRVLHLVNVPVTLVK